MKNDFWHFLKLQNWKCGRMGPVFFLQKNRFSGFHFQINQLNSHLNQLRNPLELHKNPFQAHFQDMLLLLHPHHRHCVLGIRNSDGSGTRNWIFGYYRVPEFGYPDSCIRNQPKNGFKASWTRLFFIFFAKFFAYLMIFQSFAEPYLWKNHQICPPKLW